MLFPTFSKINQQAVSQELSFFNFNSSGFYNNAQTVIKNNDCISYSYEKTPISDVYTLINVKYKKDYATDEYTKETGWVDAYDLLGNSEDGNPITREIGTVTEQMGYSYSKLGLTRESNILELESDYIRDEKSAIELRDYLMLFNCNPHLIIKLELPLKYINLECGDVIEFDELLGGKKAFGYDYTTKCQVHIFGIQFMVKI